MTDKQTPPDWVLIEAAKRSQFSKPDATALRREYHMFGRSPLRALCDMIERYEQPPVDRKLLCAREAYARWTESDTDLIGVRAIELWEEGFGK